MEKEDMRSLFGRYGYWMVNDICPFTLSKDRSNRVPPLVDFSPSTPCVKRSRRFRSRGLFNVR